MKKVFMALVVMLAASGAAHAQKYFKAQAGENVIYFENKAAIELSIKGTKATVTELTATAYKAATAQIADSKGGNTDGVAKRSDDKCKRFCVLNELTGTGYYCVSKCDVDCCADVIILTPAKPQQKK